MNHKLTNNITELLKSMAELRHQDHGCQWCKNQTPDSLIPHTLEEAYEVADAVDNSSPEDLKNELADLLFQIIFHAQIADENNDFDFNDIVEALTTKIKRRNPHVFESKQHLTIDEIAENWENIKKAEQESKLKKQPSKSLISHNNSTPAIPSQHKTNILCRSPNAPTNISHAPDKNNACTNQKDSIFDNITNNLPALPMAQKIQQKAAHAGFQWPALENILSKLNEESAELVAAVNNNDKANIEEEMGDLFLTLVNLTVKLKIDPELALRKSNTKFKNRVKHIETQLQKDNKQMCDMDFETLLTLWDQAKSQQREAT